MKVFKIIFVLLISGLFNSVGAQDKPDDGIRYKVVENMPRFPGCEDLMVSDRKKEDCAKQKMLEFLYSNLVYPESAKENKVEGMVVLQFVVTSEGYLDDIKVVRDIGEGCGDAALDVIYKMNDMEERWIPGMQRGIPIKVLYTLPVRFRLNND